MWYNQFKTAILLASLSGLLMLIGGLLGGTKGLIIFFVIALIMNGISYFPFSDKLVLRMYKAQSRLIRAHMAGSMTLCMNLLPTVVCPCQNYGWLKHRWPMPSLRVVIPLISVAVTTGILDILDREELRGVLAHEISHIKNRDILISSVAATLATAIGFYS